MPLTVSVAIATYNGEDFIAEQLRSLAAQTRLPDEIIVVDDSSTDSTIEVVRSVADQQRQPIRLTINEANLGVIGNFENAVTQCSGDLIFLCDQDDFWHPSKVQIFAERFNRDPEVGLLFSNAVLVDKQLQPLNQTLWHAVRLSKTEHQRLQSTEAFFLLLKRFLVTGATVAFRRSFLDVLLPFSRHLLHDAWIALIISSISRLGIVEQPLINYRQHARQQVGEREKMRSWRTQLKTARQMDRTYFTRQRAAFADVRDRVGTLSNRWVDPSIGSVIDAKVAHCDLRLQFRDQGIRAWPRMFGEFTTGNYERFSYGWKSFAQDLFL